MVGVQNAQCTLSGYLGAFWFMEHVVLLSMLSQFWIWWTLVDVSHWQGDFINCNCFFVRKSRTISSSLSVFTPKMRSNAGLAIFHNIRCHQDLFAVGILKELEIDFSSSFC